MPSLLTYRIRKVKPSGVEFCNNAHAIIEQRPSCRQNSGKVAPDADEIEVINKEHIHFFDCGANFEKVSCPECHTNINLDWWSQTMSADFDKNTGLQLIEHKLSCCSSAVSLNTLRYAFHDKISVEVVREIEATLECEISVVYQRI
ncbi:hypothetical protein AB4874_09740 [Thioclava sp. 15-R06ZXC-3]|uniref:Uncharacterized protein n=1 Tax=Thioclava arctica TaxID=3238301 RepID=A0ABV3TK89_9RHOB